MSECMFLYEADELACHDGRILNKASLVMIGYGLVGDFVAEKRSARHEISEWVTAGAGV